MNVDINVFFLDCEESDPEANAYNYVKDHLKEENIHIISTIEGFKLIETGKLTKQDVFVLEKFEGSFFEHLQKTKSLIVGPRCLIKCLLDCEQIPLGNAPVFTTAMRNLQVSASGFSGEEKEKLRKHIAWMGGYYFSNYGRNITHLVANTIKSTKYEHAALNGIPIMHPDWVDSVWTKSQASDISATDPYFDKFRLPVFYNLNITCSGLTTEKKELVMKLVNENGGIFNRAFRSQITDVVIIEKDKANTDKYKAAISYKKDVLLPEWIIDSVEKGYALPTKDYVVKNVKASTPTKTDHTISDYSQLYDISRISSGVNYDQTVNDSLCSVANVSVVPARNILNEIFTSEYKKAGLFLDGCSVYLAGFKAEEKEKLNRILNTSGATRYDEMDDNITHIIVANQAYDKKIAMLDKSSAIHIVKLEWLLDSIKQKQAVCESKYKVEMQTQEGLNAMPSPSSKKTLQSMNHSFNFKQPDVPKKKLLFSDDEPVKTVPVETDESNLLSQYANQDPVDVPDLPPPPQQPPPPPVLANQSDNLNTLSSMDFTNLDFLMGMAVFIEKDTFEEEFYNQMICEIESARGKVVHTNFKDEVDYVVVSFERAYNLDNVPVETKNVVTELWIEDCIKENKQVPIQYYHKPIPCTVSSQPLQGMTIVVSIYTNLERDFIDSLSVLLGAKCNKSFVKKESPLLVCPTAEGNKYEGALKWGFPVVTSKWLLDCASSGFKVPYEHYLVGDSPRDFPGCTSGTITTPSSTSVGKPAVTQSTVSDMPSCDFTMTPTNTTTTTTSNDFTPLRNKRVSELAGPKRKSLSIEPQGSPKTPVNAPYKCYDMFENLEEFLEDIQDESERNCLRECILEMKENQTPEIERIKRMACTPVNRRLSVPKGIPEFCTTPEFQQRMWDAFDRRWHLSTKKRKPATPFEEVRKRVFRATFEKYGVDAAEVCTPKTSNKRFHEAMDCDESDAPSPSCKQLSDFIKSCEDRRDSLKNTSSKTSGGSSRAVDMDFLPQTEEINTETFENSEAMVGWRDPSELSLSRKLRTSGKRFEGTPCFSISCTSETLKAELIEKILHLGGEVCPNLNSYDPKCTHYLMEAPNRGEKFLACISGGKWILTLDYIADSFKDQYFLDEELYEWGNERSLNYESLSDEDRATTRAGFYWRDKISKMGETGHYGAFTEFTVILKIVEKYFPSFKNVVEAGQGALVDVQPPYSAKKIQGVTHCFVDMKKCPINRSDYEVLASNGIEVFSHMYINSYLLKPETSDLEAYRIKI